MKAFIEPIGSSTSGRLRKSSLRCMLASRVHDSVESPSSTAVGDGVGTGNTRVDLIVELYMSDPQCRGDYLNK